MFREYYKNLEQTQNSKFTYKGKEYFDTGTRGILYENGYFKLTGRKSRFYIISSLDKVYCDKVQNAMSSIDCIDEVVFVQKPDSEMLFTGKAFIVLKKGYEKTEETKQQIIKLCKMPISLSNGEVINLKEFEIPASIEFLDKLPLTKADKIDYKILEEMAEKEYVEESKKLVLR